MTDFWIIEDIIFTGINSTTSGVAPLVDEYWYITPWVVESFGGTHTKAVIDINNAFPLATSKSVDLLYRVSDGTNWSGFGRASLTLHNFTGITAIDYISTTRMRFTLKTPTAPPDHMAITHTQYLDYTTISPPIEYNDLVGHPTLTFADSQLSWDSQLPNLFTDSVIIDRFSLPDPVSYVKVGANTYRISNDNHREIYRAKTYLTGHVYNQFDVIYRNDTSVYVVLEDGSGDYDESGNILDADADERDNYLMNISPALTYFNMNYNRGVGHQPNLLPKVSEKLGIVSNSQVKINMQTVLKDGSKIILGIG